MRKLFLTSVLLSVMGLAVSPTLGQDKKETPKDAPKKEAPKADEKGGAPEMTPEEIAMWTEFMKSQSPGEHHAVFASMVGKWTLTGKHRMAPEQPWETWTAKSEFKTILGGRYVTQTTTGDAPMGEGMPIFEGFGIMGYDTHKKVHTSSWMDNFVTYGMHSEGTCSGNCKEITMQATFADPMNNYENTTEKWVYKMDGADKITFSTHRPGADGKEYMTMEIVYTRAK